MSISSELQAISKIVYPSGMPHAWYMQNPALQDIKKVESPKLTGGELYNFAVSYSQGANGSANYTRTSTNAGNNKYARFQVTRITDYAIARMNGEDYEALADDYTSIVNAWKDKVLGAYHEAMRSAAVQLFRNGTGSRGTLTGTVTDQTMTLGTISDVTGFYAGMVVQASAADGGALRDSGARETVAAVNRATGVLTATSADWNTVITALASGDYIYRDGDGANGSTNVTFTGWGSWLVGGSSPAALFGATRTTDPVALAGTAVDCTSITGMDEAVLEVAQRVSIQDASKKVLYTNPRDKVNLVKLLEAKARFSRPQQGSGASVGFDGITFESDSGPIELKGDINCPRNQFFLVAPEFCEAFSLGKIGKILKQDGQEVRARDAYDAYEMRIGTYGNFAVRFPGAMGRGYNWGL